jgi:hypothetical protein
VLLHEQCRWSHLTFPVSAFLMLYLSCTSKVQRHLIDACCMHDENQLRHGGRVGGVVGVEVQVVSRQLVGSYHCSVKQVQCAAAPPPPPTTPPDGNPGVHAPGVYLSVCCCQLKTLSPPMVVQPPPQQKQNVHGHPWTLADTCTVADGLPQRLLTRLHRLPG